MKRVLFLLIVAAFFISACSTTDTNPPTSIPTVIPSQDQSPSALDGRALLQERCTLCHNLNLVEQASKSEDQWRTSVERMISKGTVLNAEEKEALVQFLAQTYP